MSCDRRIIVEELMLAISVVVVNYNGKHFLEACLSSLEKQTFRDFEVILVDNGSSDGSLEYVREHFPTVRVIALSENLGFCGGNNVGIRAAQGKYIALLNNDAEVHPCWLEELKNALDNHSDVGFCASKMFLRDQPGIIDAAGGIFYSCGVGAQRGYRERENGRFGKAEYVFSACAGAVIYRRSMLDDIGLFDEDFFAHGEEVDLSFRAQLRGYKCLFVPLAVVYHTGGGTMKHDSDERRYLWHRNRFYVLVKNMPGDLLVRNLFPIVAYSFLRDVSWLLQGKGRLVFRVKFDGLKNFKKMLQKREDIQRRRKVSSRYINSIMTTKWWSAL
jgi:GT2 family glycosyltransferase